MNGVIIDTESYSGTQRDNIVIYLTTTDADCSVTIPVESGTGTSSTGSQNNTSTGETSTGMIIEQNPPNPISQEGTGTVITGSTNTASVISDSGITNSGIIVTETTNTATSSTGSQDNSSTGGTIVGAIDTGTGDQTPLNPPFSGGLDATDTGATNTGTITEPNLPNPIFQGGTGESNTGTTNTGTIESGSSLPMDGGIVHTGTTNTGIIQNSSTPTIEHSNT